MRIAVIGSGVSGLTAAALLAQAHHRVIVYEQSETIGGVTAGIEKDGYRWDLGQMFAVPGLMIPIINAEWWSTSELTVTRRRTSMERLSATTTSAMTLTALFANVRSGSSTKAGTATWCIYPPYILQTWPPPAHQAVTVYTIAPNDPVNGSWRADKERWADTLLILAEKQIPGLRAHARARIVLTPEDFRVHTHLAHHAFGGCPPRLDRSPPPHRTPIHGLWFIGAQSEAYGGVVGAQKTVAMLPRQRA